VGRLGLLAKEAVLQSPKKNMTGRRRKLIFNPQEIQEYDQKPLVYSEYLLIALPFSCVLSSFISIGSSFLF
jgi:hypothetical protein